MLVPQCKPLSPGELLGCTPLKIRYVDVHIYFGDGRFHLERAMISNPSLRAARYDPYSEVFTEQKYLHSEMIALRFKAVEEARTAKRFCVIFGTLGRHGSPEILQCFASTSRSKSQLFHRIDIRDQTGKSGENWRIWCTGMGTNCLPAT